MARPALEERPCPVCGASVEPLRAREVLLLSDGFRYLCDAECRRRFLQGERDPAASRGSQRPPKKPRKKRAPTPPPRMPRTRVPVSADRSAAYRALEQPSDPPPWLGLGASGVALVLGALATGPILRTLSVLAVAVAVGSASVAAWPARREVGWVAWLIAPAGALVAAAAALLPQGPGADPRLLLSGAAIAAATVVLRAWLDVRSSRPVREMVRLLAARMPAQVRVTEPSTEWATEPTFEWVPAARIRAG